ncbi:hypothetical protein KM043_015567 [Ampulex compressa]|nr:hypothetical protein KM043_015567 [Ampulex compressa]
MLTVEATYLRQHDVHESDSKHGAGLANSLAECSRPNPTQDPVVRPRCASVINRRFRSWSAARDEIKSEDSGGVDYESRHRYEATHSIMLLTPGTSIFLARR